MKKHLIVLLLTIFSTGAMGQVGGGAGEALSKDIMALVSFAEMGNVASKDRDCSATPFPITNIKKLVNTEIRATVEKMFETEGKGRKINKDQNITEMLLMINQLPYLKNNGDLVIESLYQQKKTEAFSAYGQSGMCAGLSSMIQTIIHQRRTSIRDITLQLKNSGH